MARRRLTSATLEDIEQKGGALYAADLSARLLGRGATDNELVTAGALLFRGLGPKGIKKLHRMASAVFSETGESFGTESDEIDAGPVPQPDPSKTQDYVSHVETPPNESVLPVAMHSTKPPAETHEPTGYRAGGTRRAKDEEEDEDDLPSMEEEDKDDDFNAEDFEEDEDDDDGEEEGDEEEDDDDAWGEKAGQDEDEETDEDFDGGEDDEDHDEDFDDLDGGEETAGLDDMDHMDEFGDEPIDFHEGGEGEGQFEGIDQEAYYDEESDEVMSGQENKEFDDHDVERLRRHLGLKGLKGSKKKGRAASKGGFRPSRTRVANSGGSSGNEFDSVFGVPDVSDEFAL